MRKNWATLLADRMIGISLMVVDDGRRVENKAPPNTIARHERRSFHLVKLGEGNAIL